MGNSLSKKKIECPQCCGKGELLIYCKALLSYEMRVCDLCTGKGMIRKN